MFPLPLANFRAAATYRLSVSARRAELLVLCWCVLCYVMCVPTTPVPGCSRVKRKHQHKLSLTHAMFGSHSDQDNWLQRSQSFPQLHTFATAAFLKWSRSIFYVFFSWEHIPVGGVWVLTKHMTFALVLLVHDIYFFCSLTDILMYLDWVFFCKVLKKLMAIRRRIVAPS